MKINPASNIKKTYMVHLILSRLAQPQMTKPLILHITWKKRGKYGHRVDRVFEKYKTSQGW